MSRCHHRKLPERSSLLAGPRPPDGVGFVSERLQIRYNRTDTPWRDDAPHAHAESDECFIVLCGALSVEVEGERRVVGPGEFCCFPVGVYHAVAAVETPAETLMIRAPSVADKVYRDSA